MTRFGHLFDDPDRLVQRLVMAEALARRGEGPLARRRPARGGPPRAGGPAGPRSSEPEPEDD